ncbi:transglutaminase family protein [Paraburkholderia panacisoli]|uniref:Transglutaminase family protein n=1 Tax=Paraburkholderia panacisoli TaxID=2603818 RepID=A0A5B0G5T7_9BURK|nr:transglutaminase family protein [Paraburkholderia panacisoli]KAA0997951.1 transglutaminase family protein [Paraburkholderia panacisoli]
MSAPQRLSVRHVSVYRYSEPVSFGEHRMMFRPRASHDLRLLTMELLITPTPVRLHWLHDVFDNSVAIATFKGKATELLFKSEVTLEHYEAPLPDYSLEGYAATWPFAYTNEEASDLVNARNREYPDDEVDTWARRFLAPHGKTGTMALLRAMALEIKNEFLYVRRTEKGVNRPGDTLRHRSGSCRDFAVLMMDAVRSLGLAARFVSGYIFVPNHDATQGGGATHAWLQIYLPGAGWVDFDPTNSIVGNRHLIRVAVAWNYYQALPLWGTWHGAMHSFRGLDVEVIVTEEPDVTATQSAHS